MFYDQLHYDLKPKLNIDGGDVEFNLNSSFRKGGKEMKKVPRTSMNYRSAGVDVISGDRASEILFNAAKATWPNRGGMFGEVVAKSNGFRTSRYIQGETNSSFCFGLNFDGVGTKVELAERLGDYRGLGSDLLAMICDDASVQGAEPVLVGSIIDMGKVDLEIIRQLATGLVEAAQSARVAVINGELAELPERIRGFGSSPINWGGACLWAARPENLQRDDPPIPGDVLIGVSEWGFRSNGYSLIRAIFRDTYGDGWGTAQSGTETDLVRYAARPSIIYSPFILELTGGLVNPRVHGVKNLVHITGGGLFGRTKHLCQEYHVGADIDCTILPTPGEMIEIQQLGNVEMREAYSTWNMGVGLLVVCTEDSSSRIVEIGQSSGLTASKIGVITDEPKLTIRYYNHASDHINM